MLRGHSSDEKHPAAMTEDNEDEKREQRGGSRIERANPFGETKMDEEQLPGTKRPWKGGNVDNAVDCPLKVPAWSMGLRGRRGSSAVEYRGAL